jgi:DNA-damage-inducible protein J
VLSTARISVNVDGDVKKDAQRILSEIGIDMTTAIDLLLRAIIREERIPFELRTHKSYQEEMYRQFIREELTKSRIEAANPNTKWLSQTEVMTKLAEQREARHGL